MQRVAKVKVTAAKQVQDAITYVRMFLDAVKTNTAFPALNNPPPTTPVPNVPTYTQINDAANALQTQQDIVQAGSTKDATLLRKDLYNVLFEPVTGLIPLAVSYIEGQGGTDASTLASSGLNLTQIEVFPITVVSQPTTPTLEPPTVKVGGKRTFVTGSLEAKTKKVPGAVAYIYNLVQVGSTIVIPPVQTGQIKYKFTKLPSGQPLASGQQYMVTVTAVGRRAGVVSTVSGPAYCVCL